MKIVRNFSNAVFNGLQELNGKRIIGTPIFFYVPSYMNVVERIITGFKHYKCLRNCPWQKNEYGFHIDPELPFSDIGVYEGGYSLKLVSPSNLPSRETTMLVDDRSMICAYSAGEKVVGGHIYGNAQTAVNDMPLIRQVITPAKDGILIPQKRRLAFVG